MDSFLKDVLSAIILASWVFPVLYLSLALVVGKLVVLYRGIRGMGESRPAVGLRSLKVHAPACPATSSGNAPAAIRMSPVAAPGVATPMARLVRPRLASRWKSSQRVSASAC